MSANKADLTPPIASSHLQGLLHVASLKNSELFTIVVATIHKWIRSTQRHKKDNLKNANWKDIALRVAIDVAKGEAKCCCQDCWVDRYEELSTTSNDSETTAEMLSFAEALNGLNDEECGKKRLQNALQGISTLDSSDIHTQISIRQIIGLIRTSTTLKDEESTSLQVHAMSILLKRKPPLTTTPRDIFLVLQQPILRKMSWDVFVQSGIRFVSSQSESEFQSLLHLDFDRTDDAHVGSKRKRVEARNDIRENWSTIHFILEAGHLARKGVVRAKHGAIIYTTTTAAAVGTDGFQIIGRGWNHDYLMNRSQHQKNKLNLHSEVHAVADAIKRFGEDECFEHLFPNATIVIVELASDYGYEASHPCPKCDPMLRAVGIPRVIHTTPDGTTVELHLGKGNVNLLQNENVAVALRAACNEQNVICQRLEKEWSSR